MRVAFFGNCDDSWEYLMPLLRRSVDPADPVQLVAVVAPPRPMSRQEQIKFGAKRRVDDLLFTVRRRSPDLNTVGWQRKMTAIANTTGAVMSWAPTVRDQGVHDLVAHQRADIGIVSGLNQIFDAASIESLPPLYNFHPSPLPAYRGGSPEFWQLADGVSESALTVHRIDTGVDTGPIVRQERFVVEPWHDVSAFGRASKDIGIRLLDELLGDWPETAPLESPHTASYGPRPTRSDKVVPSDRPWQHVINRARAVGWASPLLLDVPRADWDAQSALSRAVADGTDVTTLHVRDPFPFPDHHEAPGTVRLVDGGGVLVSCASGAVFFRTVHVVERPTAH
jgi:methionyl-tRNA formyltransferase